MGDLDNLREALEDEKKALEYYENAAASVADPRLKEMFELFAANEAWHVKELEKKIKENE